MKKAALYTLVVTLLLIFSVLTDDRAEKIEKVIVCFMYIPIYLMAVGVLSGWY